MSNEKTTLPTKVVTDEVRFSYLNAFVPRRAPGSTKDKYCVCLLIPKSNTALKAKLDAAVKAAIEVGRTSTNPKIAWGGKVPPVLKLPIRDGDVEKPDKPEYAGMWFINANSDNKPGVVDKDLNAILSATEIYSGCYGKSAVNFYPFGGANKGIACGLNNLQKLRDGEPLSGGASAESDFGGEDNDDL